jgi:hypothetical protein
MRRRTPKVESPDVVEHSRRFSPTHLVEVDEMATCILAAQPRVTNPHLATADSIAQQVMATTEGFDLAFVRSVVRETLGRLAALGRVSETARRYAELGDGFDDELAGRLRCLADQLQE